MAWRMRCSRGSLGCGRRFNLKRRPEAYKRSPKCPYCRSVFIVDVMAQRRKELDDRVICKCSAYPFPHVAGEIRMCIHHPLDEVEPTEEEWRQYEGTLRTERGSTCAPVPPDPLTAGLGIRRSRKTESEEPPF